MSMREFHTLKEGILGSALDGFDSSKLDEDLYTPWKAYLIDRLHQILRGAFNQP
jgi:hypothetical protein